MSSLSERKDIERHASPEALAAMLDENIGKQRHLTKEAAWLSRTLRIRLRQTRNGEWLPPKEDT